MSTSPNPAPVGLKVPSAGLGARRKIPLSITVPSKAALKAMEQADEEKIEKLQGVDPAHPDYSPEVFMLVYGNLAPQEGDTCPFPDKDDKNCELIKK